MSTRAPTERDIEPPNLPEDDTNETGHVQRDDESIATSEDISRDRQQEPGPLDVIEGHVLGRHVKLVFRCWVVVFGLVGAQMGWVLRPFVGDPDLPFQWFRQRESNFFQAVWQSLTALFTGTG